MSERKYSGEGWVDWASKVADLQAQLAEAKEDSARLDKLRRFLREQMGSAPYKTCCDGYEAACQDALQELEHSQ